MKKHCCSRMQSQIEDWKCDTHQTKFECADALIDYNLKFDEYGIIIHDGGEAISLIEFCPYCGTKLPESKRDLWFDTLENMGIDPWEEEVPNEFKSDAWYKKD